MTENFLRWYLSRPEEAPSKQMHAVQSVDLEQAQDQHQGDDDHQQLPHLLHGVKKLAA